GKTVNEPRIAVEGENDWLVRSEQRVEIVIRKAMRMLALRLQFHEIHDVDNTHLQVGRVSAKEGDSCQSLQCWDIAAASHHDIGLLATIIAGPFPDPKPGSAVLDRLVHRQPLRGRLFASDNDVDVVSAAQAVVCD